MHELGITQNIVAIVSEQSEGRKVLRVKLEIGKLAAIVPDAIRFCFDVCSEGTVMEGAILEIEEIDGKGTCRLCGKDFPLTIMVGVCPCGSRETLCTAGTELNIKEMEVA